jgi:hypothetical protein
MFEATRARARFPWLGVLGLAFVAASFGAVVAFRPPPPEPLAPVALPFSWDAIGLKLHKSPAVVRCFDERARSADDDRDQVVTIVFGADVDGWDPDALSVEAGPHDDLERCLTRAVRPLKILPRDATKSLGWRVKLATWDRHPVGASAER